MEIPKKIQAALENEQIVFFVGSGLSRKFNLPTWNQLVENIITDSEKEKYRGFIKLMNEGVMSALDVLDFLKDEHTEIRKYIKTNFNILNGDFSLHKKILQLSGKVVTTNYDNAFERADETIIPTIHDSTFNVSELNKNNDKFIFKIHGSFNEPDSCILFKGDYENLYSIDNPAISKFKTLFTDKLIVFIGFSFNDPYVNSLFANLDKVFGNNNKHYIISTEADSKKFDYLEYINIDHYDNLESVIDRFQEIKNKTITPVFDVSTLPQKKHEKIKISVLFPNPLDISALDEYKSIVKCFDDLNVELYWGYLNFKTLQLIDEYDYLFIITKCFKGKLYIEDEALKSQLITYDELCSSVLNDTIIKIVVTNENFESSNLPVIKILSFKPAIVNRFIYKTLRNHDLNYVGEEINLCSIQSLPQKITKGCISTNTIYDIKENLDFGKRTFSGILGRVEEQSSITKSLLKIINSNKLLNVKGSGGIGKTTLIKKCAYELYYRGYFKSGVSFISCENVKTYIDFEDLLIDGFRLLNVINFKEYLITNVNKLDILIILDNFETVTNIENRTDFDKVLSLLEFATDYANIVLTSRESLGLEFEDIYALTPMITDDASKLFLRDYGAITDVEELKILRTEILENILNNNPLAIKLVTTSRTRFTNIRQLKEQLEKHFFESTSEDFTLIFKNDADINIEKSKSIYQSINYSYLTCNPLERISFELLHLFPDGISLTDFKKCFSKTISNNNITDRQLRVLRDKSLVEDNNGVLILQPIIRRFAELQFNKRDVETKQKYFSDAYVFSCFILDVIRFFEKKKSLSTALKVHNSFRNNLMNVLGYIDQIEINESGFVRNKSYLLNYAYQISPYIINEKQIFDYQAKLDKIGPYFSEIENADTLLNVLVLGKTYYYRDFDLSYKLLIEILAPEDMEKRIFKDENSNLNKCYDYISSIHSMEGFTIKYINSFILNDLDVSVDLVHDIYYLGIPVLPNNRDINFYYFEYQLMQGKLQCEMLEKYIKSLFVDEHLEIMQCTYTLSKIKEIDIAVIRKLVVTNPYTQGLKQLMLAFRSNDFTIKRTHFKEALESLVHIKYYYLEALYFYCEFLKENNNEEFISNLELGIRLSKSYYYQYILYKFNNLGESCDDVYRCNYDFYPISELEEYVTKHSSSWAAYYSRDITL